MNYAAYIVQAGNSNKKQSKNGDWKNNNKGNWNENFGNKNANSYWNGNLKNIGDYGSRRGGFFKNGNPSGHNLGRGWNANPGKSGFYGNDGFSSLFNGFGREGGKGNIICQINLKHNHSVVDYRDRFNRNFLPNFSTDDYFLMNQTPKAA